MIYDLSALQLDGSASGLCIETGLGNDAVSIVTTTVYGFLQIDTSDQVCCPTERMVAPLSIPSSQKDGIDAVALTKVNVYAAQQLPFIVEETGPVSDGCIEYGALLIYTGNQNDAVALAYVCTDCFAQIRTTDWSDSSLDGADAVTIVNSKFNQSSAVMQWLNTLSIFSSWSGLSICTGRGNDAVTLVNVNVVCKAQIETGDGTDAVAVNGLHADEICIRLGDGNHDVLTIVNSSAADAIFDGGDGSGDVLVRSHNNFGSQSISGFETVV